MISPLSAEAYTANKLPAQFSVLPAGGGRAPICSVLGSSLRDRDYICSFSHFQSFFSRSKSTLRLGESLSLGTELVEAPTGLEVTDEEG